jgi:hypothetical protein
LGVDLCSKDRVIRASHGTSGAGNGAVEKLDVGGDAAVVAAALEGDGEVMELAIVLDKARRGFRLDTLVNICPRWLVGQVADGEVGDAEGFGLGIALELEGSVISSASGTERGEVFYGPTDWLGSHDPMTPVRYTHGSSTGLDD